MNDLYNKIEALCKNKDVNITKMCREAEVVRGNLSDLKMGRTNSLSAKNLSKIAMYFNVPIDFLLGRPPFDNWDLIEKNREDFLNHVKIHPETLKEIWGIDLATANSVTLSSFIKFVADAIASAEMTACGEWNIKEKGFQVYTIEQFKQWNKPILDSNEQKETAPAPLTRRDERDIEKRLAAALGDLEHASRADGLMFDGEPLDDETKELLAASLRSTLEMTKRLAKQKYTPKKYRKEGE